jgi:hypothetical protein
MFLASTTIGAGASTTGLTISGSATTTGDLFLGSKLRIGSDIELYRLAANILYTPNTFWSAGLISPAAYGGVSSSDTIVIAGSTDANEGAVRLQPQGGKVSIGTSSPFATLSLHTNNGSTNKTLFAIASSTSNSTTTLFAISNTGALTQLGGASSTFSNGFNLSAGCFSVNGVCMELFSTTSANYFIAQPLAQGLAFSTTSANAWSTYGLGFSTTSANYWGTTGSGFSTTSANYWSTLGLGFSTTSASNFFRIGLAFSTTTNNTWTGGNIFNANIGKRLYL